MTILRFINVFLLTLVTGVFWGTWFSLSRSIESTTPSTFLEIGRTMIANLGGSMSVLFPLALLSSLPVLYSLYLEKQRRPLFLALSGLMLFIASLIVTLVVNVPIDGQINSWTVSTLPTDWEAIRDRWELWHTVRTFASLAGLACVFTSLLDAPHSRRVEAAEPAGSAGLQFPRREVERAQAR